MAPCTWDIIRLLTSIQCGADALNATRAEALAVSQACLEAYRAALIGGKPLWVERETTGRPGEGAAHRAARTQARGIPRQAHGAQKPPPRAEGGRRESPARHRCPEEAGHRFHGPLCRHPAGPALLPSAGHRAPHRRHRQPGGGALRGIGGGQGRARRQLPARHQGGQAIGHGTAPGAPRHKTARLAGRSQPRGGHPEPHAVA